MGLHLTSKNALYSHDTFVMTVNHPQIDKYVDNAVLGNKGKSPRTI